MTSRRAYRSRSCMVRSLPRLSTALIQHSCDIALDKPHAEEEKAEADDNAQTIRPGRSPQGLGTTVALPVARAPEPQIAPIAEDYSDIVFDEDEAKLEEKVADFKVRLRNTLLGVNLTFVADEELDQTRTLPPERHQDVWSSASLPWSDDSATPGPVPQTVATFAKHHVCRARERTLIGTCALEVVLVCWERLIWARAGEAVTIRL